MKKIKNLLLGMALLCLCTCIGGGTHSYIKRYRYNTSKSILEKAVYQVLVNSNTVTQDSVKGYYNDDTNYVTIKICNKGLQYTYVFHFYGGTKYWDTSSTSAISISYAYDEFSNGGSAGNGGIKKGGNSFRQKLLEPFEREFISKIDSLLGIKHTEE